ncbi:uncharacterized protein [Argopecten irradians]|uniref:uncharacterized protein isoform X1 n=1 Tax=Argopecten irradians TaxID=31199 RepID=UPI0037153101
MIMSSGFVLQKDVVFKIIESQFWHKALSLEMVALIQKEIEKEYSVKFSATNSDRNRLRSFLFKLKSDGLRKKRKGGRQFEAFKNQLHHEKYTWFVEVTHDQSNNLERENENLRKENEFLKQEIKENITHIRHVEKKWKASCERFQEKLNSVTPVSVKRKKPLSDCTNSYVSKIRKSEIGECKKALQFFESDECSVVEVTVIRNGKKEILSLVDDSDVSSEKILDMNMLIYVLDTFHISRSGYHELSMLFKSLPRSFSVSEQIHLINSSFNIRETPDGLGVQQSLRERIMAVVKKLIEQDSCNFEDTLHIKISGDGTKVGKKLHVVNFSFTIMNEARCGSVEGNYPIAIIRTKEKYEELKLALKDFQMEVKQLQNCEVQICEKTYKVKLYLGGDYKFLLTALGMQSICSQYSCLYCKCPKQERGDLEKQWSIKNCAFGARPVDYVYEANKSKKRKQATYSVVNEPIFPEIHLTDVVIDVLHLFLRITDKLTALLIMELRTLDNIATKSTFPSGLDKTKAKHIAQFEMVMEQLGIHFEFGVEKDTSKLYYTDLNGPEKRLLFQKLQISDILEDQERSDGIQDLWNGFLEIHDLLRSDNPYHAVVKEKVQLWGSKFVILYQSRDITPYMHILFYHVAELIEIHGNISKFTQQGLEKMNDVCTKAYFRSTNHKNNTALKQILEKQNRQHLLEHNFRDKEKTVTCSNCKKVGHRCGKCPEIC